MRAHIDPAPLVEPIAVQTTFISDVEIEDMGNGCFMITCVCPHRAAVDGTMEQKIEARHIMSRSDIIATLFKTARAIGWQLAGEIQDNLEYQAQH